MEIKGIKEYHGTHGGGAKRQKSLKKGVDNWKREWYTNKAVTSSDTKEKGP